MSVVGDLRTLAVHRGFRKLFTVRLVSQCGDGMFQAGLATLFFFNPQNLATAGAVAGAFAILLLPFTVVGPFAGPLLDRWRRRQVLAIANTARVALTVGLAAIMVTSGISVGIYVLALVTLGVNRFLLAALSAGLPQVVPRDQLLMANSITPTLGGASAAIGAALGFAVGALVPPGPLKDGVVLLVAAALFGGAALAALRLGKDELGPDRVAGSSYRWTDLRSDVRAALADLADGARYLIARRTPGMALGVMATHRFLYGVNFIALILISRNLLNDPSHATAGLATFGVLAGISLAGNGFAVILTPLAHQRLTPSAWILVCLLIGAASQAILAVSASWAPVAVSAFLLGLSVQGAKIAVDTIVQRDTEDDYRGRAFSLYDMLYNIAFVGAAALAAAVLPDTGWSPAVFGPLGLAYLALALAYRTGNARHPDAVRLGTAPEPE